MKKSNTTALFSFACEQMEKLDGKKIDVDTAKAQANLMKQANNLLKYELDKGIAMAKYENIVINEIQEL